MVREYWAEREDDWAKLMLIANSAGSLRSLCNRRCDSVAPAVSGFEGYRKDRTFIHSASGTSIDFGNSLSSWGLGRHFRMQPRAIHFFVGWGYGESSCMAYQEAVPGAGPVQAVRGA